MSEQETDRAGTGHQMALVSDIPKVYANGFSLGLSNADCNLVLVRNSEPQLVLNLSYTAAKTLAVSLSQLIASFEEATGRDVMTVDVIEQSLTRFGMEELK